MSFWFAFPLWSRMLSMSSCIYWPFVFLLLRIVWFICPFIQWLLILWEVSFLSSLHILLINPLSDV
jgi:hypothetical protein